MSGKGPVIKKICIVTAAVLAAAAAVFIIVLLASGKDAIENVRDGGNGRFTFTFDGTEHDFIVDLPDEPKGAPLVIMLHGQGNTAEVFRNTVHFEKEANPKGYAVVYVTAAADPENPEYGICWNSGLRPGKNRDVEMIKALTGYLIRTYSFDKKRVFAAGFSNGAFMVHRLAMEAEDTFCAVVSVAGFMTEYVWNEKNETNDIGIFQITGEKDELIPKNSDGSAKFNKAPAIEDVMDYWVRSNGLSGKVQEKIGKKDSVLTRYSEPDGNRQVWDLFVKEGHHSWPDEKLTGIRTNELILEFFEAQKQ